MKSASKRISRYGSGWLGLLVMGLVMAACGDNTATSISVPATVVIPAANAASSSSNAVNQAQSSVKVAVGFTAPDFTAKDVNGQNIQLSGYRGKAVLINFWAVY